jgi:hypothetical protein
MFHPETIECFNYAADIIDLGIEGIRDHKNPINPHTLTSKILFVRINSLEINCENFISSSHNPLHTNKKSL